VFDIMGKEYGFTINDVKEMTLCQLNMYLFSIEWRLVNELQAGVDAKSDYELNNRRKR